MPVIEEVTLLGFDPKIHEKINGGYRIKRTVNDTSIKKITLGSFRSRLTLVEKVKIVDAAKVDSEVLVIESDLNNSSHIDLDSLELQWGIALLVQKGLIAQERLAIILKDGESHEAF